MKPPASIHPSRRPNGPGRTVWLASFPKSGNTWIRAIVTALSTHPHLFGVNHLGSGAQPFSVAAAPGVYGLDPRWFDTRELDQLRHGLATLPAPIDQSDEPDSVAPRLRKTHEVYRSGCPGAEPFPLEATRAAILVVRDPRDVACSYAPFFGIDVDTAIDAMSADRGPGRASPAESSTAQPWGSWSTHTRSWLADDVPFPVHLVRYEDLRRDAVATLAPVFEAIGLDCTTEQLEAAVEQTRFERLKESESTKGFRETSPNTEVFFRRGTAGGWRDELTAHQVATIELHHRSTMLDLGYEPVSPPLRLDPLPAHLRIAMRLGPVDESLPDSTRLSRQVWRNQSSVLVRFGPHRRLLVEGGRTMTLDWPLLEGDEPNHEISWVAQGWGVVLATMQRGELPLHATSLRIGEHIIAFAGSSGAGKSTTALGLVKRGHELLVDDTTLVHLDDDAVRVTPYCRNLHLLPDTAERLGIDFAALDLLAGGREKAAWRPAEPPVAPSPIDGIFILRRDPTISCPNTDEVRGARRVAVLHEHLARNGLSEAFLGPEQHFEVVSRLADTCRVVVVSRPPTGWTLDAVLDLIELEVQRMPVAATSAADRPLGTS